MSELKREDLEEIREFAGDEVVEDMLLEAEPPCTEPQEGEFWVCPCGGEHPVGHTYCYHCGKSRSQEGERDREAMEQDLYGAIHLLLEYQGMCDCSAVAGMSWHQQVDALRAKYPDAILGEEDRG